VKVSLVLTKLILMTCIGTVSAVAAQKPPQTGPATPTTSPSLPATPQAQPQAAPPAAPEPTHSLEATDVASFLDGILPYAIQRGSIAGGVFVVVKDGNIVFAKGYGYADVQKHIPVRADQTLFRPGSVSKLFTWTAVMQLVGDGKLDLDRDVNDYLDFKIPPKFGRPITLRNLLTHTPGFEDGISEAFVKRQDEMMPLREYLMKHMPKRIFPPGKIVAYSNYGASLAGYIVQHVTGEQYADYIANHILKPLGMMHSTFVQPLPSQLQADMSQGYLTAADDKTIPFELIETAPAGALSATGTDMAHFMIAHLHDGQYDGTSILKPDIARLMHSPQSRMAPGMNGFALGFYQEDRNGLRIIGHAGDTTPFHSDLHLVLDKDVGVFMSFNSLGKDAEVGRLRENVFRAFLDRYFPYTPPQEKTVANPGPDAARVAGYYTESRRIDSALRVLSAMGQSSVTARPDGTIQVSMLKDLSDTEKRWREVGPLTYREVGGQTHLKFVTDEDGRIAYWISDDFIPVELAQRVYGIKQLAVFKTMWLGFIGSALLLLALWLGGWIARRRFGVSLILSPLQRRLRIAARVGAIIVLVMILGWFGFLELLEASDGDPSVNGWLIALYCVGVAGILACLTIIVDAALRIVSGPGGWLVRTGQAVLLIFTVYCLWAIFAYGMANFSLNY
jgi:CubicO group peptidase (beta-lactamase class C family)